MGTPLDTHEGVGHERARSWDDSWMPRRDEATDSVPAAHTGSQVSYDAIKPQVVDAARAGVADAFAHMDAERAAMEMNGQADRNEL